MFSHPPPSVNQPLRLQEIEGELEIGQVSAQIEDVKSVKAIMEDLITQYQDVKNNISNFDF